jgi:Transglycosylase SLT domain
MGPRAKVTGAMLALVWLLGSALPAAAVRITVPLTIDYLTLREALKHQVYGAPGGRAQLWNGPNACEYLYAQNPSFGRAGTAVKLETEGTLSLGVPIAGSCVSPITWHGIIELDAQPYLAPKLRLMFRVTDINLYDEQHQKTLIVGRGFDLIKQYFIPRFETFSFDLSPAVNEFRALAGEASPPADTVRLRQALATIRGVPPIVPTDEGVRMTLAFDAPAMGAAPPPVPSGPLSPVELSAWNRQLDQWDAFIVFAIKQLGSQIADMQVRAKLLSVLLDGRYRLVAAMNQPPAPGGPDPVRVLFLSQWRQLRDIVRTAADRGELGDHALEFMSFVSAGDALMAFDDAAPALGVRISAADLRRLARIMAPTSTADPLEFNYKEDPELQRLFGIIPPPETPGSVEPSDVSGSEPVASPMPSPAVASPPPNPSRTPTAPPAPTPSGTPTGSAQGGRSSIASFMQMTLRILSPADALAEAPAMGGRLRHLGQLLKRAVVTDSNLDPYRRDLGALLDAAADSTLDAADAPLPNYRTMVRATAWQESCWRQFVVKHGRLRYLLSSTGDVGLMQVNKHVWRGFYSIPHLEWDIAYNAGAGSQILARLTARAAAKSGRHASPAALARSAYAGYNGGPDALNRWRQPHERRELRMIDESFWRKYRALSEGQSIDILSCAASWGNAPGH